MRPFIPLGPVSRPVAYAFILLTSCLLGLNAYGQLKADFTASKTSDCENLSTTFTDQSSGNPSSWEWDLGNGAKATGRSASATYTTPGQYTVTLTVKGGGATSTKTGYVYVRDKPKVNFTASPAKGCIPFDVAFTDKSDPVDGTLSSFIWDFGDGTIGNGPNPVHTYNEKAGAVTLTVTNSYGCTNSRTISNIVEIADRLNVDFRLADNYLCAVPAELGITNASSGPGNLTYKWEFGDGAVSTAANPGKHSYAVKGVYKVKLTVTSDKGCTGSKTSDEVNVANFKTDFQLPASACANTYAVFTASTTPVLDNSAITWSVSDGAVGYGQSMHYYPYQPGPVKVTLTANYGRCQESVTRDYTVKPVPVAAFTLDQQTICDVPATVKFTDRSTGATAWSWSFGDGQSSAQQHPTVTYNNFRYYSIELTVSNKEGCSSSTSSYVNVVKPEVFVYASEYAGCEGLQVRFGNTTNTGDQVKTWEWDFGDGTKSTEPNPVHTYNKAGTFVVRLNYTTTGGCKGTALLYSEHNDIRIYKKPAPDFTSPDAPTVCGNSWVRFNDQSDIGTSWYWDFGDGNRGYGRNTQHSYREPGIYDVTLTVENEACSNSITKRAYITTAMPFPRPQLQPIDCDNRTTLRFSDQSLGAITNWQWDWGDKTPPLAYTAKTATVAHKYAQTGTYKVMLTTTQGQCVTKDSLEVKVYAPSPVTITTDKTSLCGNETLTARVTAIDNAIYDRWSYQWQSSDGTGGDWWQNYQRATFSNLKPGNTRISLTVHNLQGCPDRSNEVAVNVHGPVAKFDGPAALECRGAELLFRDLTNTSFGKPIKSWAWNFEGNGAAAVFSAPPFKHVYKRSGYYTPSLTVTDQDGCTSTYSGPLVQVNGPNAGFSPSATLVPPGGEVWFYNYTSSTGSDNTTYLWNYGDNTTSTDYQGYKVYPDKGVYDVVLIATDDNGCKDTSAQRIKVSSVNAAFTVNTSFVNGGNCPPVLARFVNNSLNYSSSSWDFGDGSTSSVNNPSHVYNEAGKYKVTLKVIGDAGTEDVIDDWVEIKGPYGEITASSDGGCLTKEITFQVNAQNASRFAWDFRDGKVEETTSTTVTHTYSTPGIYTPQLILYDAAGCKGSAKLAHPVVIDKLDVKLQPLPAFVCNEGWVTFAPVFNSYSIDELQRPATYTWSYDPALQKENEAGPTPRFYLPKQQPYNFLLTTTTAYGCTQTVAGTVNVYPVPEPAIQGPARACQDAPVSFTGEVAKVSDVSWHWDFANSATSGQQHPASQAYSRPGPYSVALKVTSKDGCSSTARHNITITPKPVINASAGSKVLCLGSSTPLFAGGGITYQWTPAEGLSNPGIANPVASPVQSTVYKVNVTDAEGCSNTDQVSLFVAQPFTIHATPDTSLCLGHVLPLRVWGGHHYEWTAGEGLDNTFAANPRAHIGSAGTYRYNVTGYDAYGCFTDNTSLQVSVHPSPTIAAGPDRMAMAGVPVQLGGRGSADITKWTWTPPQYLDCHNCPAPLAMPNLSTSYQVEVENAYGCKATDEVLVKVLCNQGAVYLPTGFTPNSDGKNERFYPKGRGVKEVAYLRIYDRWGGLVFERMRFQLNSPEAGWDGTRKNDKAPAGSYIYFMQAICESGEPFEMKGSITLIR